MKKSIIKSMAMLCLSMLFHQSIFSQTQIFYQASDSIFENPERGFYHANPSLEFDDLQNMLHNEDISLAYHNFAIDDFKNTFIPPWYLVKMNDDFAKMRLGGVKSVIRFTYTEKDTPPYGDAPIQIVLNHIAQVTPILQNNADVILAIQAGFIGTWGEWYYTDYYSTTPGHITDEQMEWRRQIVHALLNATPDRMVQVRTPIFKKEMVPLDDFTPVPETQAFENTPWARIAHHNDCFLASTTDYGTYQDIYLEKDYLADDSKFTMVGGETCNDNSLSECENALAEMERFHWTYLNRDYHSSVFGQWIDGGCYEEIHKRLGYRYRLISARLTNESKPGGTINVQLKLFNDGFANVMNTRDVKIILRNSENGEEYTVLIDTDPRLWPLNDTISLELEAGLPVNIQNSSYETFISLPDPAHTLQNNPEYSIRLANQGIFESSTAYHSLLQSININQENEVPDYEGNKFFIGNQGEIPTGIHIIIDGQPGDWSQIQPAYVTGNNLTSLKTWNTSDSLYFALLGIDIDPNWQFFINSDFDTTSGYESPYWSASGADLLIENGILYSYEGAGNDWNWSELGGLDYSKTNSFLELSISRVNQELVPLAGSIGIAIISGFDDIATADFLPPSNHSFLDCQLSVLTVAPQFIHVVNVAEKAIVYWPLAAPTAGINAELQRSVNGGSWESVFTTLHAHQMAYTDENLETGNSVDYRVRYTDGENRTPFTTTETIQITGFGDSYADIEMDGDSSDWLVLEPLMAENKNSKNVLRTFNNSANFFFSISAEEINSYEFFVSNTKADLYKISNDSLFEKTNGNWLFRKMVHAVRGNRFMEASFSWNDLFDESDTEFLVHLNINGQPVVQGELFYMLKYNTLAVPENFQVLPSIDNPYGSIRIKWRLNTSNNGYKLQRSVGDSLHFADYKTFGGNEFYFLDHELDSSQVYYYRMFSHEGIIRSPFTSTLWLQPNGISELDEYETDMKIFPNPCKETAKIELYSLAPQNVDIRLMNNQGEEVMDIFTGEIDKQQFISIQGTDLTKGVYFLRLVGEKKTINRKLIII